MEVAKTIVGDSIQVYLGNSVKFQSRTTGFQIYISVPRRDTVVYVYYFDDPSDI